MKRTRPPEPVACDCRFRHKHGTRAMYNRHRCGCFACRVAHSASEARHRAGGSVSDDLYCDAAGTRRRIHALCANGLPMSRLAEPLGVTKEAIADIAKRARVHRATAERIREVYEQLSMERPTGWLADRTRREASARGWLPPVAYDDDTIDNPDPAVDAAARAAMSPDAPTRGDVELDRIAVERYVAGTLKHREFQRYSPELVEAIRILAGRRLTDAQIGDRVGVHQRRIQGLRAEHGIPAGVAA